MLPQQSPSGNVAYEIFVSSDLANWTSIDKFTVSASDNVYIERNYVSEFSNVKGVKVLTISSPSWIGWREIEVYGH